MKIYLDKNLEKEVQDLEFGTVEAGEPQQFTFYLFNDSLGELVELEFSTSSLEVKIISAPKEMKPRGIGEIVIEYSPNVILEQKLKAELIYKGKKLFK
jgi:hypothetical protein